MTKRHAALADLDPPALSPTVANKSVRQGAASTTLATVSTPPMALLSRKGILAIAAVIDIALHASERPVSARALAERNGLPPRHLEPVLQALVREGILKGIRGPGGGYELAGARRDITAESILRAAGTVDEDEDVAMGRDASPLLTAVVAPAISQAEKTFCEALARISVEEMVERAEAVIKPKR